MKERGIAMICEYVQISKDNKAMECYYDAPAFIKNYDRLSELYNNGWLEKNAVISRYDTNKNGKWFTFLIEDEKLREIGGFELPETLPVCRRTGFSTITEPMLTYRNNNGCVSRSIEIAIVKQLNDKTAREIGEYRKNHSDNELFNYICDICN